MTDPKFWFLLLAFGQLAVVLRALSQPQGNGESFLHIAALL